LVQQKERLLASVAGSSGTSVSNFIVNVHSGKPLDTEIIEQEKGLRADKGTGSVGSDVVYSVGTGNKKVTTSGGK
jgi:hypothetical protein